MHFLFVCSVAWPFTIERPYPPEMVPFIPEIEGRVNDVLAETLEKIGDSKGIIREIQALDVTLRKDYSCKGRGLMWTDELSPDLIIYVCQEAIEYLLEFRDQESYVHVAQMLIHESIHRIGYHDECMTTKIELILMKYSPYADDAFHNDYVDECDLSDIVSNQQSTETSEPASGWQPSNHQR